MATDTIRDRLFGSEAKQKNTYLVFDEAFAEIEQALRLGRNVVFDATNVSRDRSQGRKRKIDDRVLTKFAKNFEYPLLVKDFVNCILFTLRQISV